MYSVYLKRKQSEKYGVDDEEKAFRHRASQKDYTSLLIKRCVIFFIPSSIKDPASNKYDQVLPA